MCVSFLAFRSVSDRMCAHAELRAEGNLHSRVTSGPRGLISSVGCTLKAIFPLCGSGGRGDRIFEWVVRWTV